MAEPETDVNKEGAKDEGLPTASYDGAVLGPDTKLGQFRIEREIGRGAMGIVYLAHDSKLNRQVAIKSLPPDVMANPKVLSRFSREAKLLASLNHPNIATIHDQLEGAKGTAYLVLEYVPGRTLSERIAKRGLKLKDVLLIALQIAEAVSAAHDHDVIHRDLKPGNIKITPEGKVKVLDFGIAKAVGGEAADQQSTITEPGKVIGTPQYMSPEQARGQETDRRSDIWAFGCILYEMLTATIPFRGETVSDTLANVLHTEPSWESLPENTPVSIRSLLRRCLNKNPRQRLQHIGDAAIEIREALNPPETEFATGQRPSAPTIPVRRWRLLAIGTTLLLLVVLGANALMWNNKQPTTRSSVHFPVSLLPNQTLMPQVTVSPDGKRLVYVGRIGGTNRLYLRELDQLSARELPETKGASYPFFSPDGQSIGFGDGDKLKTLLLDGGKPENLCEISGLLGGCWGADGNIYFAPSASSGLRRISAEGSEGREPEVLTYPKSEESEFCHWWPELLPGGEALLFTIWRSDLDDFIIAILSLGTGDWKTLIVGGSHARYVPTGHIIYAQAGALWATVFDLKRLKLGESRRCVVESLNQSIYNGYAPFSFSEDGMLCYARGGPWLARNELVWVSRQGQEEESLKLPQRAYMHPQLSPNEQRLAFSVFEEGVQQIWVCDMPNGPPTQLTFKSHNFLPIWLPPDGDKLTFSSWRAGPGDVYWIRENGSGPEEPIVKGPNDQGASSWSPDGKVLLYTESDPTSGDDIGILCMEDGNTPRLLVQGPRNQKNAVFSPDGSWIAYESNQEDLYEVYVVSYPGLAVKKISNGGGRNPIWSKDGKELFYRVGDKMMAANIETKPEFKVTKREVLFEDRRFDVSLDFWGSNYDVSGDSQRFLIVKQDEEQSARNQLVVVFNWFEELKSLVPTERN